MDDAEWLSPKFITVPNGLIGLKGIWGESYRQRSGFLIVPSGGVHLPGKMTFSLLIYLFVEPGGVLEEEEIAWLVARHHCTRRSIKKSLRTLRESGFLVDGRVAPEWVAKWQAAWKKAEELSLFLEFPIAS